MRGSSWCTGALLASIALACGCNRGTRISDVILAQARESAQIDVVDLREAVGGNWDKIFFFGPYWPQEEMCSNMNLSRLNCKLAFLPDLDEKMSYLAVLVKGGRVIYKERLAHVLLGEAVEHVGISRANAIFRIQKTFDRDNKLHWVVLVSASTGGRNSP